MPRIGILGGGQLAQMTIQAAVSLGVEVAVYERQPDSPAARLTPHQGVGGWDDLEALRAFAADCDLLTLENEFIYAESLDALADAGHAVYPGGRTLAVIQDKLKQKQHLAAAGLPVPRFQAVASPTALRSAAESLGWPLLLKARYGGYDGYGNATLRTEADIAPAWDKLYGARFGVMAEAWVPFVMELAVMVVRGRDGELRSYPVVETVQQNHICHVVRVPAPVDAAVAQEAQRLALAAVASLGDVGVFGVELFLLKDGHVLLNEIAPRPHNSGHYSIEGCVTSQFENHLRAVLGYPLGDTSLRAPAVVMMNLLGTRQGHADAESLREALGVTGAHLHLYGKRELRPGRKMGHVTVLARSLGDAETVVRRAVSLVDV